jgi:hypothetical protein
MLPGEVGSDFGPGGDSPIRARAVPPMIRLVLLAGDLVTIAVKSLVPGHRDSEEPVASSEVPHRLVTGPDLVSGQQSPHTVRVPLVVVRAVPVQTRHHSASAGRRDRGEPGDPRGARGGRRASAASAAPRARRSSPRCRDGGETASRCCPDRSRKASRRAAQHRPAHRRGQFVPSAAPRHARPSPAGRCSPRRSV